MRCLLVENNAADIDLARYAIQVSGLELELEVAETGEAALERLRNPNGGGALDLVLLDLHLPDLDGEDVLRAIRSDEALTHMPVIVVSGSDDPSAFRSAYDLHANACVEKPIGFDDYVEAMRAIVSFWRGFVQLPTPT